MTRLALDINGCYTTRAGVARYIRGLLKGLGEVAPVDFEIVPVAWKTENLSYQQPQRALKTFYREFIWAGMIAPRKLREMGADVLHSPNPPLITPPAGVREVITLHDLAVLRNPQRFRRWQRHSTRHRLGLIQRADAIVCISQFTADEAMALLELPAKKLVVVHNGCDFNPAQANLAGFVPDFAVPAEFFLFVGSLEPGKNLDLIRQVYALAESQGKNLPPLLIVGARWAGVGNEGQPPKNWHYLGHVEDGLLAHLYLRAIALIFPTKYEGFGFPIVEAMSLGCPVICSRVASLPEVGGDAAKFVAMTPPAYLEAMLLLLRQPEIRAEQVAKGLAWVAKFSWRRCATETLEIYRRLMQ